MTDGPVRTVRVWADTVTGGTSRCRLRKCRGPIWFAQTVGRGKMMPFDGAKRPVREDVELGTGRKIWELAETQIHFGNCKARPAPERKAMQGLAAAPEWQDRYDN